MKNIFKLSLVLATIMPSWCFAIGAFAVDDERGDYEAGYGISSGHETEEEAFEAALETCRNAGNDHCRKVLWFEACGSYAASESEYGTGWGNSAQDAQDMAMEKCNDSDCRIVATECE
jgi:hypothetical protein